MTSLTLAEIEQSLLSYRVARRLVRTLLLEYIVSSERLTNPFLLLSRLFIRLKSADSVLEKIQRKGLVVQSVSEIGQVMDDLLGFRIITENLEELWALDQFLTVNFEVKSRTDKINSPGQFGYRSIEYALVYHGSDLEIPFEVQLRTLLQHYWASCSFHLFHKASPTLAAEYEQTLISLSQNLQNAEQLASSLRTTKKKSVPLHEARPDLDRLPIQSRVHLIVVEPGERFARQATLAMTGNDLRDHQAIVDRKLALYAEYPGAAIVECTCMSFLTFVLNEPHVEIPPERIDRIVWQ
jgi:ppGpp synthetase/RelA/SpoT-type nucleotidyltranferase